MNMQGINFGMDGPNITGWWVNPKTGDKFNAIDTFFEDNNLLIKTADGRLLNFNQIQNYVRTESDPGNITPKTTKKEDEIPPEILAELEGDDQQGQSNGLLIPDDNIYGTGGPRQAPAAELGNLYKEGQEPRPPIQDFDIIDRALNGKDIPSLTADVTWDKFPKREIEMLTEVMNISEDEIARYYINKVSLNIIKDMVEEGIIHYIYHSLHEDGSIGKFVGSHVKVTSNSELARMIEERTKEKSIEIGSVSTSNYRNYPDQSTVTAQASAPETKSKKTKKKIDG